MTYVLCRNNFLFKAAPNRQARAWTWTKNLFSLSSRQLVSVVFVVSVCGCRKTLQHQQVVLMRVQMGLISQPWLSASVSFWSPSG